MNSRLVSTDAAVAGASMGPGSVDTADDAERARRIRSTVRARSVELRRRHPILGHQSAIGAGILAFASAGVVGVAVAYATHVIPWWVAVPAAGMFISLSHEIQHDLIHRLYFSRNAVAHDVMMAVTWLLEPLLSPWARRPLHLLHHEASGTVRDVEEILITNGRRWGPLRVVMMLDPVAAFVFLRRDSRHRLIEAVRTLIGQIGDLPNRRRKVAAALKLAFPIPVIALAIWYSFLVLSVLRVVDPTRAAVLPLADVVTFLGVVWLGPNALRVACLHGISSNMHYFGDVEEDNVVQQTQVLNPWWLFPAQLFCVDFGSTHAIHHFVPGDPFYVRHMIRKEAHRVMRTNGVRFNDLGTFRRANRRYAA